MSAQSQGKMLSARDVLGEELLSVMVARGYSITPLSAPAEDFRLAISVNQKDGSLDAFVTVVAAPVPGSYRLTPRLP